MSPPGVRFQLCAFETYMPKELVNNTQSLANMRVNKKRTSSRAFFFVLEIVGVGAYDLLYLLYLLL